MLGKHCIKTWGASQGAYALSSAEAELYAMIEGVTRAKGLKNLALELGFIDLCNTTTLGTDSSAARSFVCRRGLGKMRHLEIRDLWLQKEVQDGKLQVIKIPGEENPADLMTKILSVKDIVDRLRYMNIRFAVISNIDSVVAQADANIQCTWPIDHWPICTGSDGGVGLWDCGGARGLWRGQGTGTRGELGSGDFDPSRLAQCRFSRF